MGPFKMRIFLSSHRLGEERRSIKNSKLSEQQIALLLNQLNDGFSIDEVCRKVGVSEQTFYRWPKN